MKRSYKQKMLAALLNNGWDTINRAEAIARLELMSDLAIGLLPGNPLLKKLDEAREKIYKHFETATEKKVNEPP